ncbi:conserved hypothetical protein [Cenarchaeum symbiosum A]|uniref:Uncharacterized protein n=1 Tax=Cenarchaeum symbiosum (strain A) TaxID=414004 RepID=A0RYU7_CENSY|nr:conserved hypothetical protein [Cenarchaeum symbiosum A]
MRTPVLFIAPALLFVLGADAQQADEPVFSELDEELESSNPSLISELVELPGAEFNRVARESPQLYLENLHDTSWQVTLINDLVYANPEGIAAIRFHDDTIEGKFIEVGMGGPPEHRFWVAVSLPGDEGYVVVHQRDERGWVPEGKALVSYTDRSGLTVNNGMRIVVTNLDIKDFAIGSYSFYGLQGSTDPPGVNSGVLTAEFLSGDPGQNPLSFFPFYVSAAVGLVVGILFLTKKRN